MSVAPELIHVALTLVIGKRSRSSTRHLPYHPNSLNWPYAARSRRAPPQAKVRLLVINRRASLESKYVAHSSYKLDATVHCIGVDPGCQACSINSVERGSR